MSILPNCGSNFDNVASENSDDYSVNPNAESIPNRFIPRERKGLNQKNWTSSFDEYGKLAKIDQVLKRIKRGGIEPSIRAQVWEYLLGIYSPENTTEEREKMRESRMFAFYALKSECKRIEPLVGNRVIFDYPRVKEDGSPADNFPVIKITERNFCISEKVTLPDPPLTNLTVAEEVVQSTEKDRNNNNINNNNDNNNNLCSMLDNFDDKLWVGWGARLFQEKIKQELKNNIGKSNKVFPLVKEEGDEKESMDEGSLPSVKKRVIFKKENFESDKKMHSRKEIDWLLSLHQIGLDVLRTDRNLKFYENSENRGRMMDILAIYSWYDQEIGYCQGMSDLISPFIILFPNDSDAFWCFERLMDKVRKNFKGDRKSLGIQSQLSSLANVIKTLDPDLSRHLDDCGAGSYLFAVKMMMALFRRELSFSDCLYLWEIMWAMDYEPPNVVAAVLIRNLHSFTNSNSSTNSLACSKEMAIDMDKNQTLSKSSYPKSQHVSKSKGLTLGPYRKDTVKFREKLRKSAGKGKKENVKEEDNLDFNSQTIFTFCVAAILLWRKKTLLNNTHALDEVMKEFNEIVQQMDLKKVCKSAKLLHKRYLKLRLKKVSR